MKTTKSRMTVNKGGNGGVTFRATLPVAWIRKMGLDEDNKNLILEFKEDMIMIKKDNIFLVVTEDNNIIYDIEEVNLQERDQVVYESDIESLVETELDDGIHLDEKEDYETELDFYLSNVIREDFVTHCIDTQLDTVTLTQEAKIIIQEEVITRIKDRLKEGVLKLI